MTKTITAVLTFDSFTTSPAFGVRSGSSVARQMLFSAGDIDLDIRLAPDDGRWSISGQILGEETEGAVELSSAAETCHAELDGLGEFSLATVPPGNYGLRFRLSDLEIEVPEFNLRG